MSYWCALFIFCFSLSAMAQVPASTSKLTLQIKSRAEIDRKDEILLTDIIEARGLSPEAFTRLRSVRLADSPKRGEARYFTDVGLLPILRPVVRELEKEMGQRLNLVIPAKVVVVRKSLQLTAEDVKVELSRQFQQMCGTCFVEINQLSMPAVDLTLPSGASWSLRLRPEMPKGSFSYPIEIRFDDATKRTLWISGQITVYRMVPVAKRMVQAGESLTEADFAMEKRDVTFENDAPATREEILGSIAARGWLAQQTIGRSGLRKQDAVKLGDTVRVVTGTDTWQIAIDGIAQQNGYLGDQIKVKIGRTQKQLSGILKEKGLVEVR